MRPREKTTGWFVIRTVLSRAKRDTSVSSVSIHKAFPRRTPIVVWTSHLLMALLVPKAATTIVIVIITLLLPPSRCAGHREFSLIPSCPMEFIYYTNKYIHHVQTHTSICWQKVWMDGNWMIEGSESWWLSDGAVYPLGMLLCRLL